MSDENKLRDRYYGLRVGDIVKCKTYRVERATVIELGGSDNNRCRIREHAATNVLSSRRPISVPAEWCEILQKVDEGEVKDETGS